MGARLWPPLPTYSCDPSNGGAFVIADVVTELGIPGSYMVRLHTRIDGYPVRATYSASGTGAYRFDRIAYRYKGYYVIAFDHGADPVNAAIGDLITPEVMSP